MLTLEQKIAVESTDPYILVSAAAGSGKTRVITERMKRLLSEGIPGKNIICITYTRNAADEMRTRLADVDLDGAFIGTIHAYALMLMKATGKEFNLYDDTYDLKYHQYFIDKYDTDITLEKYKKFKQQQKKIIVDIDDADTILSRTEEWELNKMWVGGFGPDNETIQDLCDKDNVITFEQLIEMAVAYYKENQIEIEHVLVDEFQDISTLEYNFIKQINAKNYFFCGDDYQSIYGFKGGNLNIFLQEAKNPKCKLLKLTENFRSCMNILEYADKIIQSLPERLDKIVVPHRKQFGKVEITMPKETEGLKKVISIVKGMSDEDLKDTFILCRTNKLLGELSSEFTKNGVEVITFRQGDLNNDEIKELMESNKPKLLSIHSSKGLEAKNVFLFGTYSPIIPRWKKEKYEEALRNYEATFDIYEEQRIFYVAVTRAKDNFYLIEFSGNGKNIYRPKVIKDLEECYGRKKK